MQQRMGSTDRLSESLSSNARRNDWSQMRHWLGLYWESSDKFCRENEIHRVGSLNHHLTIKNST